MRRNPAEMVTLPRVERKEIQPLTDAQVGTLAAAIGSDGYGTLLKVVVFTGLRLAEAIGLTWDCVDFEKRRLTINKQLQKRPLAEGGFTFTPLKNDKTRVIAPAPFVLELLKRWRQVQAEERLKAGLGVAGLEKRERAPECFCLYHPFGNSPPPSNRLHPLQKIRNGNRCFQRPGA